MQVKLLQDMLNDRRSVIALLAICSFFLCGQLIAQLYTVNQLHKVSGVVTGKGVRKTGYSMGKPAKPQYSLILTLDSRLTFAIDIDKENWNIENEVFLNNPVTIYYPTTMYNFLSLNCLDFGSRVCQVENYGEVVYSFRSQQKKLWPFTICLSIAVLLFSYQLYQFQLDDEIE